MGLLSKTRESTTMQLLLIPLALINYKYISSDSVSVTEYVQAYAVLLAIWLGREWKSAAYPKGDK